MIPKSGKSPLDSRKSVGIHEFAALARSSLNGRTCISQILPFSHEKPQFHALTCRSLFCPGISQAVRDHVTKPTSLAQGRVAHLIEWKGWPKPTDPPPAAHAHFSSYCHLTEGEKEARFAAGIVTFDPSPCLVSCVPCLNKTHVCRSLFVLFWRILLLASIWPPQHHLLTRSHLLSRT